MDELETRKLLDEERSKSNNRYAIKLVEKIVFWVIGTIAGAVIVGAVTLFFTWLGEKLIK